MSALDHEQGENAKPVQSSQPKLLRVGLHAAGAGAVMAALALAYLLTYRPMELLRRRAVERCEQLEELLANSLEVRREHFRLREELTQLSLRVKQTRERVPERPLESAFLGVAARIAEEEGFYIEDFRRLSAVAKPMHSEVEITLSGEGNHTSLSRLLRRLEQAPRATRVQKLQIESSENSNAYPVTITYKLYFGLKKS